MYEATFVSYEQLPESEKDNWGKYSSEDATFLVITVDDVITLVTRDTFEPEDATFGRDLNFIVGELNGAYAKGREDGLAEGYEIGYMDGRTAACGGE